MLGETIVGQLSLVGLDGYPRVVPVWFDFRDGEILISNAPGTYKCRSIGRGARVGFALSDPSPPYRLVPITAPGQAAWRRRRPRGGQGGDPARPVRGGLALGRARGAHRPG